MKLFAHTSQSLRETVFNMFHQPAHPGPKVTDRLIRQRYIWPNMHRDMPRMCKNCLDCQKSKIFRHVKLVPDKFVALDGRFDHVHIDLVGPLPNRNSVEYILTMTDRFSRWVEAVPLREISAQTVARAFYDTWVSAMVLQRSSLPIRVGNSNHAYSRLFCP